MLDSTPEEKLYGVIWNTLFGDGKSMPVDTALKNAVGQFSRVARRAARSPRRPRRHVGTADILISFARTPYTPFINIVRTRANDEGPADAAAAIALFQHYRARTTSSAATAPTRTIPVALLMTWDVSASDFLPKILQGGPKVRLFGPGPSMGAFGTFMQYSLWGMMHWSIGIEDAITPDGTAALHPRRRSRRAGAAQAERSPRRQGHGARGCDGLAQNGAQAMRRAHCTAPRWRVAGSRSCRSRAVRRADSARGVTPAGCRAGRAPRRDARRPTAARTPVRPSAASRHARASARSTRPTTCSTATSSTRAWMRIQYPWFGVETTRWIVTGARCRNGLRCVEIPLGQYIVGAFVWPDAGSSTSSYYAKPAGSGELQRRGRWRAGAAGRLSRATGATCPRPRASPPRKPTAGATSPRPTRFRRDTGNTFWALIVSARKTRDGADPGGRCLAPRGRERRLDGPCAQRLAGPRAARRARPGRLRQAPAATAQERAGSGEEPHGAALFIRSQQVTLVRPCWTRAVCAGLSRFLDGASASVESFRAFLPTRRE